MSFLRTQNFQQILPCAGLNLTQSAGNRRKRKIGKRIDIKNASIIRKMKNQNKELLSVSDMYVAFNQRDNGGRRSGMERRRFSYAGHIPERRSGEDRRVTADRRSQQERRNLKDRRGGNNTVLALENRRSPADRRSGGDRRDFMLL